MLRRRLKELKAPAYTAEESERAAGLGVDNRQRGVEDVVRRMESMAAEPAIQEEARRQAQSHAAEAKSS